MPLLITGLLFCRCPPAVSGLVIAVDINAVYGSAFRCPPHVSKEGAEAISPFFAHTDAATSVILIFLVIWVITTSLGVRPGFVFSGAFPVFGIAEAFSMALATQTSAAFGIADSQSAVVNNSHFSAIASAIPKALGGSPLGPTHYREFLETPTNKVGFIYRSHTY